MFIKLTDIQNDPIIISVSNIVFIDLLRCTRIHLIAGEKLFEKEVKETPEQILKLIKESKDEIR